MSVRAYIHNSSYLYFFFTSLGIFIYALMILIVGNDDLVSFSLFKNHFSIDRFQLTILFKVAYLLPALGYYLAERMKLHLNRKLTLIHTWVSVITVVLNGVISWINQPHNGPDTNVLNQNVSMWLIGITLFVQPLFLYNLAQAIAKRKPETIA